MVHETVKLGADNPDNFYVSARISGRHRYRVWGKRGTAFYLGFATQLADYTKDEPQVSGSLEADDLKMGPTVPSRSSFQSTSPRAMAREL
jgi:hypothetical protein